MTHSIGLDIGHSAVKVAAGENLLFPTAATPAVVLSVESASSSAKDDTVRVGSESYFVGETAVIHTNGRVLDGLSDDWISTDEHAALLVAGYQKALRSMGTDKASVVLGLPSRLHGSQKERLREIAAANLMIGKDKIFVIPQPLAAFFTRTLNADGTPTEAAAERERWLVIDVGYYTTDFGMLTNGTWSAAGQESISGTSVAAATLKRLIADKHSVDLTVRACEELLRTKSVRLRGERIDLASLVEEAVKPVAKSIIDSAVQVFGAGSVDSVDGIFIAGGGSALLFDVLKKAWPQAVCAENPRFAVAEGMRRFGLAKALLAAV
jgi:plasmid segregation protein ParM